MADLSLQNLSKSYTQKPDPVVTAFSLEIPSGELVALLGPSGSGKSTILKMVAGIETPDSGEIYLGGTRLLGIPSNHRSTVMMFQKSYLFPFLSVGENIAFGLRARRVPGKVIRAEVGRMLELIGLPGVENRRPNNLSGGEQQRVALARALVTNPKVLLLDEPLNSLDTSVRLSLQEAIRNIQRQLGITTVLVTHDLGEAMSISDRMALIKDGRLVAVGRPEQLFHQPPSLDAARFMGVDTFLEGRQANGQLETGLGTLKISCEAGKSGRSTYAIRPEHIRLQKEGGENTLPGKVLDCLFRGEFVEYQVALDCMTVRARIPMPTPAFPHGELVQVKFPVQHLFEVKS
jgi:ABC-type Fe3+/spermidine/putrescine transport system ATPase subunit